MPLPRHLLPACLASLLALSSSIASGSLIRADDPTTTCDEPVSTPGDPGSTPDDPGDWTDDPNAGWEEPIEVPDEPFNPDDPGWPRDDEGPWTTCDLPGPSDDAGEFDPVLAWALRGETTPGFDLSAIFEGLFGPNLPFDPALERAGMRMLKAMDRAAGTIADAAAEAMNSVQSLKRPGPRRLEVALRKAQASLVESCESAEQRCVQVVREELSKFGEFFPPEIVEEIASDLRVGLKGMTDSALNDLRTLRKGSAGPKASRSEALGTYSVLMSDPTGRFADLPVARLTLNPDYSVRGSILVGRIGGMLDEDSAQLLADALGARTPAKGLRWMERGRRVQIVGPLGRAMAQQRGAGTELTMQDLDVLLWKVVAVTGEEALAGDDAQAIIDEFGSLSDWIESFTFRLVKQQGQSPTTNQ